MEESATEYSDGDSGHIMEVEEAIARVQEPVKLIDVFARNLTRGVLLASVDASLLRDQLK